MYAPRHFAMAETDAWNLIGQYPFATLITSTSPITISHLPLLQGPDGVTFVEGHLARANPHTGVVAAAETVAVFTGPQGYISPNWYSATDQVPTWNYQAVHVSGPVTLVETPDALAGILARQSAFLEREQPVPWTMDKLNEGKRTTLLKHIVGIRIEVTTISAKAKLSQNKPQELPGIRAGLATVNDESPTTRLRHAMADA